MKTTTTKTSDKIFNTIINIIYISGFITLMAFTIYNIINN